MKNFGVVFGIVSATLIFCLTLSWTIYGQLNNTLLHNNNWVSSKLGLSMYVFGRDEFMDQRPTLSENHLNLGAWHGYQELLTTRDFPMTRLDFDFSLERGSHLLVIFNKKPERYSAIRLSANREYPSAVLEVSQSGEFLSKNLIQITPGTDKWHHAQLSFDRIQSTVSVAVDGKEITRFPQQLPDRQQFGFRGSLKGAFIDSVMAYNGSDILFSDDFSYHDPFVAVKISLIAISLLATCFLTAWIVFLRTSDIKKACFAAVILSVNLAVALSVTETALRLYVLSMYPNPDSVLNRMLLHKVSGPSPMETYNDEQFGRYSKTFGKTLLFIGTSQTWGAGAGHSWETFPNRIAAIANGQRRSAVSNTTGSEVLVRTASPYRVLNAAISGADSSSLLGFYKKTWINLLPDLVIVNLSNNDTDPERFRDNLREFVRLNNERHITTVFILEANSPEYSPGDVNFHGVMKDVALSEHVRILDLHGFLKTKRDSGLLWWDEVHLTSYGQELTAQFIYDGIKDLL